MSQLTLLWAPWTVVVSLLVVAATIVVSFLAWRRSGFAPWFGFLELLRIAIVVLAALMLNQPEWVRKFQPDTKPTVAVYYDASASMGTRDVTAMDGSVVTREQSISKLTQPETWSAIEDQLNVVLVPFSRPANLGGDGGPGADPSASIGGANATDTADTANAADTADPSNPSNAAGTAGTAGTGDGTTAPEAVTQTAGAGQGTDLHAPLSNATERFENLRAVVLISDGDWNEGLAPVTAATQLRLNEVPIYAIPVGSETRLPDVELLSLDAPTFGVAGKAVRVPFTIESSLPREYVATVTLKTSSGDVESKEVRIAAMGRTTDAIFWKPSETGDYSLTLTVPLHADETLPDNNEITAPIAIRTENLRVLVVEGYPRWEYRYLRNALSRDPGVEVSCLLFHGGSAGVGGGTADYIKEFPAGLDELSEYDVVFLGDVGLEDGHLTPEQCRLLKGLVEFQASGLVFIPGWQGRQMSLLESELSQLYPVQMDEGQPEGWGSRTPGHFELTELGRRSLLTKLADTQDDNISVWESLPGFQWYAPVVRAKAGTEVLAVHQEMVNAHGRLPLLVTRTFGAGKVLFMGTDGAWRWREGVEDKYHYRFWGQVVRWMAYQRSMAKGETMRLHYAPDQPQRGQTIALHASVMEKSGEPLARGDVIGRITTPSGKVKTVRFTPSAEDEWGVFHSRYTTSEPGRHTITLHCKETEQSLDASFFVQGLQLERLGKPARPDVLAELARITQGKLVQPEEIDEALRSLGAMPPPPAEIRRTMLWSHPATIVTMIGLLGIFWIGRKAKGLI